MFKNDEDNYRKTVIVLSIVLIILVVWTIISFVQWFNNPNSKEISLVHNNNSVPNTEIDRDKIIKDINDKTKNVNVVATLEDKISENAAWCPTFQLVWNDLQDDFTEGKVQFVDGNNILVDNLNKQTFKEEGLSKEYYYKKYGPFDISLKKEIEKGIKEKFNETSDILNSFEWPKESNEDNKNIFFYSMLKREFTYKKEFEVIENRKFKDVEGVKYFGVYSETPKDVKNQVRVLYYNDENDFAIALNTKEKDQVIVAKGPKGETFKDVFEYVNTNDQKYEGSRSLKENETMAIPMLKIDKTRSYDEILNHVFLDKDGKERMIGQAIQTCKFEINEKGGKVKSEAGMTLIESAMTEEKSRIFDVNNDFVIMLKEPKKPLPYFMAKVSDINLFR